MALREQLSKLSLKNMGNPHALNAQPADVRELIMGNLIGIARGIVNRSNPKNPDEQFEGLSGSFRMVPTDANEMEKESGVLFIPDAFHNMIADELRQQQSTDKNATVEFVFECKVIRASNPQGYSWSFVPIIEGRGNNPIDLMLARTPELTQAKVAQITDARAKKVGEKKR